MKPFCCMKAIVVEREREREQVNKSNANNNNIELNSHATREREKERERERERNLITNIRTEKKILHDNDHNSNFDPNTHTLGVESAHDSSRREWLMSDDSHEDRR